MGCFLFKVVRVVDFFVSVCNGVVVNVGGVCGVC